MPQSSDRDDESASYAGLIGTLDTDLGPVDWDTALSKSTGFVGRVVASDHVDASCDAVIPDYWLEREIQLPRPVGRIAPPERRWRSHLPSGSRSADLIEDRRLLIAV